MLVSRQGKTRLTKWFVQKSPKEKARAVRELTATVLSRAPKMCNFIEWQDKKVTSTVMYFISLLRCLVSRFALFVVERVGDLQALRILIFHRLCGQRRQ